MRLLILTQKVDYNDDLLAFFHGWIEWFSLKCETVNVICLEKGEYNLPENVRVYSLGKEASKNILSDKDPETSEPVSAFKRAGYLKKIKYAYNFFRLIFSLRRGYDTVLVHMNPEYVVLGGWWWRLTGKKIGLWYTHKQVNAKLKWAHKFVHIIFTASEESFRLPSKKVHVLGHGIDIVRFGLVKREKKDFFSILYVGRISSIKNQKLLIEALNILVNIRKVSDVKVTLVGGTFYPEDKLYLAELRELVNRYKLNEKVELAGSIANSDLAPFYVQSDLLVNLCPTGGMDKVVLESMATGSPVLVLNRTFAADLDPLEQGMLLSQEDSEELADKIVKIKYWNDGKRYEMGQKLRAIVAEKYEASQLVGNIVKMLDK